MYHKTSNISCTSVGNKIVACWHCSNYIFIVDLTPGFNGLGKDQCQTRWETFKFCNLVQIISEVYMKMHYIIQDSFREQNPLCWTLCWKAVQSIVESPINTMRLIQNGQHFADDIIECIFFNENQYISINIPL